MFQNLVENVTCETRAKNVASANQIAMIDVIKAFFSESNCVNAITWYFHLGSPSVNPRIATITKTKKKKNMTVTVNQISCDDYKKLMVQTSTSFLLGSNFSNISFATLYVSVSITFSSWKKIQKKFISLISFLFLEFYVLQPRNGTSFEIDFSTTFKWNTILSLLLNFIILQNLWDHCIHNNTV